MLHPTQVPFFGPLADFASGFASELLRQGYTVNSARLQMNLMAHLSRWLMDEGLDVRSLSATEVDQFLATRRAVGYVNHRGCSLYIARKRRAKPL